MRITSRGERFPFMFSILCIKNCHHHTVRIYWPILNLLYSTPWWHLASLSPFISTLSVTKNKDFAAISFSWIFSNNCSLSSLLFPVQRWDTHTTHAGLTHTKRGTATGTTTKAFWILPPPQHKAQKSVLVVVYNNLNINNKRVSCLLSFEKLAQLLLLAFHNQIWPKERYLAQLGNLSIIS